MHNNGRTDASGLPEADRDEGWIAERQYEVLRAISEVEKRTLLANILGTALIVGIAQMLPNGRAFLLPAVFRFVAILLTAIVYERMRKEISESRSIQRTITAGMAVGVLGGSSWALLLMPLLLEPSLHPAAFLVFGGIMICVSLVITNTSSTLHIWAPFTIAFLATAGIGLAAAPGDFALVMGPGLVLVFAAVSLFSFGAAKQRIVAADMLVQNMRLGEELAEALSQAEFLATRDPLTGLYNRRAIFEHKLHAEALCDPGHMMVIDVDRFKRVNDKFGHDRGDRLLIAIAASFRDGLRELDGDTHFAARLGGEEFAVFIDVPDVDDAIAIAEDLRLRIENLANQEKLPAGLATASIGLSPLRKGETVGDALQRADDALYEAKSGGRNKVCYNPA
ncbi:GGDEF domain-containing protein [Qipengyuania sp. 1XM1-15A]|uniref:GGDEF domain-containing protein n=1 Tax=Qipengyuania xiamenensis TaxID=2867237 RepID=UPI001C878C91|nr:GGDEF domain-containing protein [Qipengyuania xiamenensis]